MLSLKKPCRASPSDPEPHATRSTGIFLVRGMVECRVVRDQKNGTNARREAQPVRNRELRSPALPRAGASLGASGALREIRVALHETKIRDPEILALWRAARRFATAKEARRCRAMCVRAATRRERETSAPLPGDGADDPSWARASEQKPRNDERRPRGAPLVVRISENLDSLEAAQGLVGAGAASAPSASRSRSSAMRRSSSGSSPSS